MGIIVENPGIQTTVQDEGRFGYQQFGVSPAGPMDTQSFYLANILAGNPRGESALEITFMGPSLKFEKDNIIAVTGANVSPAVDGSPIPMYQAVLVHEGQTLSCLRPPVVPAHLRGLLPQSAFYGARRACGLRPCASLSENRTTAFARFPNHGCTGCRRPCREIRCQAWRPRFSTAQAPR